MPKLFYFSIRHEITWTVNLKPMNYSEEVIVWETGLNIEQRCSDFEVILVWPPWEVAGNHRPGANVCSYMQMHASK